MKIIVNSSFLSEKNQILNMINDFDDTGLTLGNQKRNTIKIFNVNSKKINIKSFRTPTFFNSLIYNNFRKSKAQRSYEYANKLISLGIMTPSPIGYAQNSSLFWLKRSYYVSKHLDYDFTFREVSSDLSFDDSVNILKAFTRFTYKFHEKGVNFLDHSPGNTLIKKTNNNYDFYLVDLNRMAFTKMTLSSRIKNFSRLSHNKDIVKIMSSEYAKCIGVSSEVVFELMWEQVKIFRQKVNRKRKFKSLLKIS
jgi:hypothetical protein